MDSIWTETIIIPEKNRLENNLQTDVVIIGAGITGILTAYFLEKSGLKTIILEANKIASGQTKHTTAKITSQHGLIYQSLLKTLGEETTKLYAKKNENAISYYQKLIQDLNIDCDFKLCYSYLYSTKNLKPLEEEVNIAKKSGIDAYLTFDTELPFPIKGAACFKNQAQFHPLKFLKFLSKSLTIYEQSQVLSIDKEKQIVKTQHGCIKADYIVIATHFPFINSPGYYFMRMHQERSYVLALTNIKPMKNLYYGIDKDDFSFRGFQEYLLLGGGSHRTGKKGSQECYSLLRNFSNKWYPGSIETGHWAAQDCMTLDGLPYIGCYSSSTPNIFVATGFGKWGMTNSMIAAKTLTKQILKKENNANKIFSPNRFHASASMSQLIEDGTQSIKGLTKEKFTFPKETLPEISEGEGNIIQYNGKKIGVYKDKKGNLFFVSVKCPHLGCELSWNKEELSWDCPCHGSRFDYHGNLIDNPAMEDIKI